jgi:all-trans-8'-apo-beta-carotenal 15,15'-oxygenase
MTATATRQAADASARDARADSFGALQDLPREHGFEPLDVDGTIPADLRGTIYRNGASLFSAGGRRYDHWFDGDGGLSAVRLDGGRATGAARIIQSAGLREERAAGKLLYGGFGTVQPGLLRRLRGKVKNTANTSVMSWQGRLLAMMEATLPTEVDPDTLETVGETDLGGVIPRAFSAHPHYVPQRKAIYNYGVRYGKETMLDLFELPFEGRPRRLGSLPLPGPTLLHDFIVTESYLVFFIVPLRLRIVRMFLGLGGFSDNLAWKPELGTEVIAVPIDAPGRAVRFTTDAFHVWHYGNAFERNGEIVVDFVRYPDFESNRWLTELFQGRTGAGASRDTTGVTGSLYRAVIDLDRKRMTASEIWARPCEFPRVAPADDAADYRWLYAAAHAAGDEGLGFQNVIAKVDMTTGAATEYQLPAGQYTSEPVFAPRPGATEHDDGYLLALAYDADRHASACVILDARDLEAGPVARAWFDHHIPPRFHGVWVG